MNLLNLLPIKNYEETKTSINEYITKLFNEIKEDKTKLLDNDFQKEIVKLNLFWFYYYQGNLELEKGVELYPKLVSEEKEEVELAWKVLFGLDTFKKEGKVADSELLDGYIDTIWVMLGNNYFKLLDSYSKNFKLIKGNELYIVFDNMNELKEEVVDKYVNSTLIPTDMFYITWLEILRSNWTKSLELRNETDAEGKVGKVIKGENYSEPEIKKVLKEYL